MEKEENNYAFIDSKIKNGVNSIFNPGSTKHITLYVLGLRGRDKNYKKIRTREVEENLKKIDF